MFKKVIKYFFISLAFLCIIYYFYLLLKYTLNIPFWDDYLTLDFLAHFVKTASISEKISLLLSQEEEHRLVFRRLLYLLSYWISGEVNFKYLCYAGNLFLFGIVIFLAWTFLNKHFEFIYFVPVIFIIFSGQHYATSFWTESSIVYYSSNYFIIISLYCISKNSIKYFIVSIILAVFAVFSYGNGFVVFLIGILLLIYQKRYQQLAIYCVILLLVSGIYFYEYKTPVSSNNLIENFNLSAFIKTLLSFIGGISPYYSISIMFGLLGFGFIFYLTYKQYYKKNLFIYSILLYLLITGIIVAINRPLGNVMRYKFYHSLFLVFFYFAIIDIIDKKWLKLFSYISIYVFFIYMMFFNELLFFEVRIINENELVSLENWNRENSLMGFRNYNSVYGKALKYDLYTPPQIRKELLFSKKLNMDYLKLNNKVIYTIDTLVNTDSSLFVRGTAFIKLDRKKYNNNVYIVLLSSNHKFSYLAKIEFRPDLLKTISDMTPMYSGFDVWINTNDLPKGTYKIGLYLNQKYRNTFFQYVLSKIDYTFAIESFTLTDKTINL